MRQSDKRLLNLFHQLTPAQQDMLVEFGEFLATRKEREAAPAIQLPAAIPRPEKESVVKAIQRLMATYPMLDRRKLLGDTSNFMSKHVIEGVPAPQVIDELEAAFRKHYDRYVEEAGGQ